MVCFNVSIYYFIFYFIILIHLQDKTEEESDLSRATLTSITEESFLSRSTQLQRRVSEAIWRHQLILHDSISKTYGSTERLSLHRDRNLDDFGYGM